MADLSDEIAETGGQGQSFRLGAVAPPQLENVLDDAVEAADVVVENLEQPILHLAPPFLPQQIAGVADGRQGLRISWAMLAVRRPGRPA